MQKINASRLLKWASWKGMQCWFLLCTKFFLPDGQHCSQGLNLEELNEKLRSSCFLRRTKDGVLPQLPQKECVVTYVRGSKLLAVEDPMPPLLTPLQHRCWWWTTCRLDGRHITKPLFPFLFSGVFPRKKTGPFNPFHICPQWIVSCRNSHLQIC